MILTWLGSDDDDVVRRGLTIAERAARGAHQTARALSEEQNESP